jgi:pimeloyl-ACP methyl ester carboxylesterase
VEALDVSAPPVESGEQTRARYPDETGFVERDGVRSFYEVYGEGDPTVLLVPTWSIIHSRVWKGQIPYLARHFRLVCFDGRGNGRSDRPPNPEDYAEEEFAADILAVMDATATERAVLVCLSRGIERSMLFAAEHPDRVEGIVAIGPALPLPPAEPRNTAYAEFETPRESYDGWGKWNLNYWLEDYEGFLEFFFSQVFTEAHSTKQREDSVAWALESDPKTLIATQLAPRLPDAASVRELAGRVRCPLMVVHGTDDAVRPHDSGAALAEIMGAKLVSLPGVGHSPGARYPVKVNLLIREFVESLDGR